MASGPEVQVISAEEEEEEEEQARLAPMGESGDHAQYPPLVMSDSASRLAALKQGRCGGWCSLLVLGISMHCGEV